MIAGVAVAVALLPAFVEPPVIETHTTTVTIPADGQVHEVPFSTFATTAPAGVELALYAENVSASGACEAGWGVLGVELRAPVPGTCTVTALPHDPLSGAIAAAPATITVTAEVPTSAPAPAADPAADAPPPASSPSHRPVPAGSSGSPLPLVLAWVVLVGGWAAAIAVNRRERRFS